MKKQNPNQKQGPRVGNAGNDAKRREFASEKDQRTSYFKQLSNMVMDRLTERGESHRSVISPGLEPISPNTRVRRGPTKGNK